jgi:hypothetical protein
LAGTGGRRTQTVCTTARKTTAPAPGPEPIVDDHGRGSDRHSGELGPAAPGRRPRTVAESVDLDPHERDRSDRPSHDDQPQSDGQTAGLAAGESDRRGD